MRQLNRNDLIMKVIQIPIAKISVQTATQTVFHEIEKTSVTF